ncbi:MULTISPECIES: hypothetical protein [Streptomyces]|uniref:hypothetical protein n=1 Tax=Streptomyces TaxID=1883 RepID=UPI00071FF2C6|nr:hypothetical protein [Streptomyces sp. FR-008]ALM38197.1 hypothetical protein SFR_1582 [Streptomyces sp. FR-008]KAF0795844.1 hypothetical protein P405_00335 [Streptomyces sp. FR-008]
MTLLARRLYFPSTVAVALGTVIAISGVLVGHFTMWRLGLVCLVAAIPALCYCLAQRASQASDDQLADMHRAGYRLALQHVALGLLDSPAAPPDGGEGAPSEDTQGLSIVRPAELPDNVRRLRARDNRNRKAV